MRSGEIVVKKVKTFYSKLGELFEYRGIEMLSVKPVYHGEAHELRRRYGELTYFDSLHAAVGITENMELVSYDKIYAEIRELEYNHPGKYV